MGFVFVDLTKTTASELFNLVHKMAASMISEEDVFEFNVHDSGIVILFYRGIQHGGVIKLYCTEVGSMIVVKYYSIEVYNMVAA